MSNTNWEKMVYEKDLNSAKSTRRKVVDTLKIKADDLPQYVDDGWEKSKEYKNPKYISVTRWNRSLLLTGWRLLRGR